MRLTNEQTCRNERGELVVGSACEGVILVRMTGMFDAQHCQTLLAFLQSIDAVSAESFTTFHDLEAMVNYDAAARVELTRWTLARRRKQLALHFLLRSKIVALGLEIANAALGGSLTTHRDRASFERAYEAAIRASATLPRRRV